MSEPLKFSLKPDIYPHRFCFYFGEWDEEKVTDYCYRLRIIKGGILVKEGDAHGIHFPLEYGSLIWMPRKPEKASCYSHLMHELVHAVGHCGDRIGMGRLQECEEFHAYLVGWLSLNLFKRLW